MDIMREVRIVIPDELDRVLEGIVSTGLFSSKAEVVRATDTPLRGVAAE